MLSCGASGANKEIEKLTGRLMSCRLMEEEKPHAHPSSMKVGFWYVLLSQVEEEAQGRFMENIVLV